VTVLSLTDDEIQAHTAGMEAESSRIALVDRTSWKTQVTKQARRRCDLMRESELWYTFRSQMTGDHAERVRMEAGLCDNDWLNLDLTCHGDAVIASVQPSDDNSNLEFGWPEGYEDPTIGRCSSQLYVLEISLRTHLT